MANPLALALGPAGAQTASGEGAVLDIGTLRSGARLELLVSALAGDPDVLLEVKLATSEQSAGPFRVVGGFPAITATGAAKVEASFADLDRYVRATWTISGGSPSFTFQIVGAAHVLYAEPRHVRRFGAREGAIGKVTDAELAEFCINASTEADGYLAKGHKLPLQAWDVDDLGMHVAKIVVYRYLNSKGRQPLGPDDVIDKDFNGAIRWLTAVGKGVINPPGLVDATPDAAEFGYCVETEEPRGWGI